MRPVCLSVYINFKISKQNRQEKWSPCWVHCGRVSIFELCIFLASARMFSATEWRRKKCKTKQNVVEIYFKRNFGACALCHCNGCWKMKLLYGLHNWIAINHKRLYHDLWSNVENYSNYSPCSHIFFCSLSVCLSICEFITSHFVNAFLCACVRACASECIAIDQMRID